MSQETKQDRKETMMEAFSMFDTDHDGKISVQEFAQVTRAMNCNPTDAEIKEFVKSLDKDNNGTLDFDEFKKFYKTYTSQHTNEKEEIYNGTLDFDEFKKFYKTYTSQHKNEKEEICNAFKLFDKNGDGFIDAKELRQVLKDIGQTLSQEEVDDMLECADKNHDGRINYVEFTEFICGK